MCCTIDVSGAGGTLNRLTSTRSLPGMVNQDGVSDEEILPVKQSSRLSNSTPDILDVPDGPGGITGSDTKSGEEGTDAPDGHPDEGRLRPPSRSEKEQSGSQEEM